jgi:hypothetical protein
MSKDTQQLIPDEAIRCRILVIRGQKVMLDRDLALLYGVKPIALRQQVKRNPERFPEDFMFRLSKEEMEICKLARALNRDIYSISGRSAFARDFGLRDQIRQASVSIASNIAGSSKDFTL